MITYIKKDGSTFRFYTVVNVGKKEVIHEIHIPNVLHEKYRGDRINAVKIMRDNTGLGIKELVQAIDGQRNITVTEVNHIEGV